ncbi:hypothetical protein Hena1_02580 [Erwinia phage Hena1]|uniref:Uncharacterized protein n=1 Tax=Erwinia phage Hena1 TaxID=2678601 RepID=A0A6B9J6H1_9CAUD|nr:hypothetical protein HWC84_gp106 [Erwinia phage Hena1]QGZ16408.1 hypothetical protein Hena1_02580 [Erwinia phage Hena1]
MFSFITSLFRKKPAVVVPPAPARGIIAKAESEFRIITVEHKGGDHFEIMEYSKITKQGSGVYRRYEHRAMQHFHFYRSFTNAKIIAL